MFLYKARERFVARAGLNLLDRQPSKGPMWADVLNKDLLTGSIRRQGFSGEQRVWVVAQAVDVVQARIAETQAENVENPLRTVDRATIVRKSDLQHLVAKRSSKPKHGYEFVRFIFAWTGHCRSPNAMTLKCRLTPELSRTAARNGGVVHVTMQPSREAVSA